MSKCIHCIGHSHLSDHIFGIGILCNHIYIYIHYIAKSIGSPPSNEPVKTSQVLPH